MCFRTKKEFCTGIEHHLRMHLAPPELPQTALEGLPNYRASIQALPASERAFFATKELQRLEQEIALAIVQENRWQDFVRSWAIEFSAWVLEHTPLVEVHAWKYSNEKELIGDDRDAERQIADTHRSQSPTPMPQRLLPFGTGNLLFDRLRWNGFWLLEASNAISIEKARAGVLEGAVLQTYGLPEFLEQLYFGHWRVFEKGKTPLALLKEQKAFVERELLLWGNAVLKPKPLEAPAEALVIRFEFEGSNLDRELLNESRFRKHPIQWMKPELAAPLFEALMRENYLRIDNSPQALKYHGGASKQERLKIGDRLLWVRVKSDLIHLQNALHDANIWGKNNINKVLEENFVFLTKVGDGVELTLESEFSDLRSKLKCESGWGNEQKIRSLVASLPRG